MAYWKAWATLLVVTPFVGCKAPPSQRVFDYGANLGIAVQKTGRNCLDIRNGTLSSGQRFQFVTTLMPQAVGEAEITGKVDQACTAEAQNELGLSHYEFKVVSGSLEKAAPAFALANFSGTLTRGEAGVTSDLDGDGRPESFRSCTSSEGVHLTVWSGKPLEGPRKWHAYYYLGYDVEPTCTEGETKGDSP